MAEILYLTELLGLPVYDLKGRVLGRVKDAALVPLIDPARVDRYLLGGGLAWLTVRHDQVERIGLDGIHLRDEKLTPYHNDEYMLRLVRDLLDQQIIDARGRKVVRVTDVTFEIAAVANGHDVLRITEVDVGLRSVIRRLAQGVLTPKIVRRVQRPISVQSISWAFCNVVEADPQRRLRLNITNDLLERMHPADIADIVEELGPEDREAILSTMDKEVAAETLSEVDPELQAQILESMEPETAADIIEEMDPSEAADVIEELEDAVAAEIIEELEPETKSEVSELLEFEDDSAGRLMGTEYVAVAAKLTAGEARHGLRASAEILEQVNLVYLLDERDRLTGAVPVARLFLAEGDVPVEKLKIEELHQVPVTEVQAEVIEMFDKYNLLSLPVTDETGQLVGVITADDIITALRAK
ncbi:MAG: CBS domain-containing protein [Bryobacteraceae bacterium]|nr:CBS domain-containing protein [Bryobacteraceae bacterium]